MGTFSIMQWLKHITWLRIYLVICGIAICAFTYAEYYGYVLTGSDENPRTTTGSHYGSGSGYGAHHK